MCYVYIKVLQYDFMCYDICMFWGLQLLYSKPYHFYVLGLIVAIQQTPTLLCFWGLQLLNQQTSLQFEAYSCLVSKPQQLPCTWVRIMICVIVYDICSQFMCMIMFHACSRFSLLGIRLIPLCFICAGKQLWRREDSWQLGNVY